MKLRNLSRLLILVIACNLLGAIGGLFTASSVGGWYLDLAKPVFNPPNWVFGPVWGLLFTLMGIALFLVIKDGLDSPLKKLALLFFGLQFVFNILWSALFFGLQNPFWAFLDILVLLALIILTIAKFYKVSRWSAYLLVPYLLWVTFAAVLNFSIWQLNL